MTGTPSFKANWRADVLSPNKPKTLDEGSPMKAMSASSHAWSPTKLNKSLKTHDHSTEKFMTDANRECVNTDTMGTQSKIKGARKSGSLTYTFAKFSFSLSKP